MSAFRSECFAARVFVKCIRQMYFYGPMVRGEVEGFKNQLIYNKLIFL